MNDRLRVVPRVGVAVAVSNEGSGSKESEVIVEVPLPVRVVSAVPKVAVAGFEKFGKNGVTIEATIEGIEGAKTNTVVSGVNNSGETPKSEELLFPPLFGATRVHPVVRLHTMEVWSITGPSPVAPDAVFWIPMSICLNLSLERGDEHRSNAPPQNA